MISLPWPFWASSPPFFSAVTKTTANIGNWALRTNPKLPPHRLESLANLQHSPSVLPAPPSSVAGPFWAVIPPCDKCCAFHIRPLRYLDIYCQ